MNLLDAYIDERRRQDDRFNFPYIYNLSVKNEFFDACNGFRYIDAINMIDFVSTLGLKLSTLRYTAIHTQTNTVLSLYKYTHDFLRWIKTKVQIAIEKNVSNV
ncbi:MAG: hypothetical protein EOP45_15495 [Sphingobacteriaceae bacterium]|nr:MAG: hypothetical protein EOP45_15495 [Sphingobacteriaceae bacterium]